MVYETFDEDFDKINQEAQIYTFIKDKLGEELFEQTNATTGVTTLPQLRVLSYMVGPIRILQMRTKKKNWVKVFKNEKDSWFHEDYDTDHQERDDIWTGYEWCSFKGTKSTGKCLLSKYFCTILKFPKPYW